MKDISILLRPVQWHLPLLLLGSVILSGAAHGGGDAGLTYDQNSWREVIGDDCRAFFDGCNNCVRGSEDSTMAACTRKACPEYQQPRCRDDEAKAGDGAGSTSREVKYSCAGDNTFSVIYGEYIQDDQKIRLADSEVMFRDHQTRSVRRLQRQVSASGEKYSNASGLMLFAKGDEAMVRQAEANLYKDCSVVQ